MIGSENPEKVSGRAPGFFGRLKERLSRTRSGIVEGVANLVLGRKKIDAELLEEIETVLLRADVGVEATQAIVADLAARIARNQLDDAPALFAALREDLQAVLAPCARPLAVSAAVPAPYVIMMVGINGAGKTTTIGKLARRLQDQGRKVMLAAGDTFRAAAVEQLQAWGERNGIPVIAQARSADPASVVFDAMQAARARGMDVLIVDTAGRLHTQANLMAELGKIKRVIAKVDPEAPHEIMLVVDAGTGQNAVAQALQFHGAVGLTGITLTKLDGTARGGVIFAIARKTGIPIRFIGVGEGIEDLRVFDAAEFVNALFEA
ncbi:MAG: signal recognition particle-docking protein FtsY [Gammaproteobacteria bacterium]